MLGERYDELPELGVQRGDLLVESFDPLPGRPQRDAPSNHSRPRRIPRPTRTR